MSAPCDVHTIPAEKRLFESHPTVHVDWRWFFSKPLDCLIPRLSTLQKRFDGAKILATSAGVLKSSAVTSLDALLKSQEALLCQCELARVLGKVFEKLAKRLETCHCHERVWAARMPYTTRAKKLTQETGAAKCVWKTRMGPWFVVLGWASS